MQRLLASPILPTLALSLAVAACSGAAPARASAGNSAPMVSTTAGAPAAPASSAPPTATVSCAGPARADLTPERVSLMLQGDDDFPIEEMRALSPGVMPALVEIAASGRDGYSRSRAISMLGGLGCRETAPTVERLLGHPDRAFRLPAVVALGRLLGGEATPALTRMLGDADTGVQKFTVKTLGQVGDARAVAALEQFRTATGHAWLRDLAAQALADVHRRAGAR